MGEREVKFLMDAYELTMASGFFELEVARKEAVFDVFFRRVPDDGGFVVFCGLEQVIESLNNFKFNDADINFLREFGFFSEEFLNFLKNFKFECDVWSVEEGTPVFPNEPILIVKGPLFQAQLVETLILTIVNHQSLIATKANRIVRAAKKRPVLEFGARRAHGFDSAIYGSRAAFIGGCSATSCVEAFKRFKIPLVGTMSHSWVLSFNSELEAFRAFSKLNPDQCILLVDTFSVLKSGIKNAVTVFKELKQRNSKVKLGVRIDSGDLAYLSKKVRLALNSAGFYDAKIIVSNSLNENLIQKVLAKGAKIDEFAVGESLITSQSSPVLGCVYKLSAIEENSKLVPKLKISGCGEKINIPAFKKVFRFFDPSTKKIVADLVTLFDEEISSGEQLIFDSQTCWKKKVLKNVEAKPLLRLIFKRGDLVYELPSLIRVRKTCLENVSYLWEEVKRFKNPHQFYVNLSTKLLTLIECTLQELSEKNLF